MNRLIRKIAKLILKHQPSRFISDADLEYFLWICNLYLRIKSIPGHIAEVGVADGRNTILFGRLIKQHNDHSIRQYIGFDTFDGFNDRDLEKDSHLSANSWKNNSRASVLKRCADNDVEDIVELFEGDAVDTVPKILATHQGKKFQKGKGKFALVYIDCNAFEPALRSLENFLPYVVPGGMFVIDEKMQGGESEALIEFASKHKLEVKRLGGNEVPMTITVPQYTA